jgi:adenylyltransferase/sulfurtransferase
MSLLTRSERQRYARHLALPEVGEAGQLALREARVLLVGAGGLGAPAAMYLAAAGVGTLGLIDHDRVELANLQRQLLYRQADVGRPKLEAARETLAGVNPHVQIECHEAWLGAANALELFSGYDIVLNGCDNFPTRYLVNDACVLLGKPCVDGSVYRFEGQVTVYDTAAGGPCYRCRFPQPPPPELAPDCAAAGVFGVTAGVVGTLMAAETLKWLWRRAGLARIETLVGRALLIDLLTADLFNLTLRRDPDCPVCGPRPTITELVDGQQFCGGAAEAVAADPAAWEVSVEELAARLAAGESVTLVDVREPWEWQTARLAGARLLPLAELVERAAELPRGGPLVLHCHHGVRSLRAVALLAQRGFANARSLRGGIDAWSRQIDPGVPRY